MTLYRKKSSKTLIAAIVSLALVIGLIPALPSNEAYAAEGDKALTIEFKSGSYLEKAKDYTKSELEEKASNSVAGENYLAWDGTKYVALNSNSGIPLLDLLSDVTELSSLPSGWTVEVTNGKTTKTFNYHDIHNGQFYGASTSDTGIKEGSDESTPILSLATGSADITTTAKDATVASHDDKALRLLIGLKAKNDKDDKRSDAEYIKQENDMTRYVSGVTKITVSKPGPISNFKIYSQLQADGPKTLVKTFSRKELVDLAHEDTRAFLHYKGGWVVNATNKYIPTEDLLSKAGVLFNANDKLVPKAADDFSTTQSYEALKENKYFYGGTTATGTDLANPKAVGSVLALDWKDAEPITTGTAQYTVNSMDLTSSMNTSGRFYMGLSPENYATGSGGTAAGNRLITSPIEMTVIKDEADSIAKAAVTLNKSTQVATGKQIKPKTSVKLSGITLKEGTDYTVSYGSNKVGPGSVTITGKGNFTGKATKGFTIKPRGTSIKSVKAGKKKATVKWTKAKDAVTGYQIAYKASNAKKYKTITVKGQKNVTKTITKLTKGKKYSFKIRTYKNASKKNYYSSYSKIKKSAKIKK